MWVTSYQSNINLFQAHRKPESAKRKTKNWKGVGGMAKPRCLHLKAVKYEIQKPSTCCATLFYCKFWLMFRVFHLAWSTWPATKTFVAGWRNAACWLVDMLRHKQICRTTSCEFDEKRATKPKMWLKVDPRSTFRNNFLQPAVNVFVAEQVDHTRWQRGNIDKNLQRNNVAWQVEGFCVSHFAALTFKSNWVFVCQFKESH